MNLPKQLAKHLRDVHFGGNWTTSNLKEHLANVTLEQATTKVYNLNSIVALVYHIHYYISATLKVLNGEQLNAHDKYSFDHPQVTTEEELFTLVKKTFDDAETFASLVEQLPEEKLWENMADEKYGTWYRNIQGIIEHTHYHLGQIVIIKKIIAQNNSRNTI